MKFTRTRTVVVSLALVALGAAAACSGPESRSATAEAEVLTGPPQQLLGLGLFRCESPNFGSVTKTVGKEGGVIAVGPHGIVIPPGALSAPTTITASAPAGNNVRVDFAPHGLRFAKPVALNLSYRHCVLPPLLPRIVYVDGKLRILELIPSLNSTLTRSVTGKIDHFSGYMLAD